MQQNEFEALVKSLCEKENLPQALELLKASEDKEVAEAAQSLTGQFALAEVDGEQRIYHVFCNRMNKAKSKSLSSIL